MNKIDVPFWLLNFETGNIIRAPEYCEPKPPSFRKAKKWVIDIEGTTIEFRLPKHNHWLKGAKAKYPEKRYHLNNLKFVDNYDEDRLKDEWQLATLLANNVWKFNGPFLTGTLADIDASFLVLRNKNKDTEVSYFHPRSFENAIADFVTNSRSKPKSKGQHRYIAPVDWQAYNQLPVPAARFKIITNDTVVSYRATEFFIFTLDSDHLAYLVFNHNRDDFNARTKSELDNKIGDRYMAESVDNVINSFKISLSPSAIEQQKKSLEGLDDIRVTETFPPLKWDRDSEDTSSQLLETGSD